MVLTQVIAAFRPFFNAISPPGILLAIVTLVLEKRFLVMQLILLTSLAVSGFLELCQ